MEHLFQTGVFFGQSAFNIFYNHFNGTVNHKIDEAHLKLEGSQFDFMVKQTNSYRIKKLSNCKILLTINKLDKSTMKYFLYRKSMVDTSKNLQLEIMVNSTKQKINIDNIIDVQINILLEPLLNLRRCESLNEALMCWSLNGYFLKDQKYIKYDGSKIPVFDDGILKDALRRFLTNDNILTFVPKQFINKIKKIHNSKQKNINEVMDIITNINRYFIKKVQTYFRKEKISTITSYDLNFKIELYCDDLNHQNNNRKSLSFIRKNKDDIHLKSLAILFNLRWFFNTRYNHQESFGLDGEYGKCSTGYGQTFHKYDDVILWLITHPNTLNEVELVVLDPIPPQYIWF